MVYCVRIRLISILCKILEDKQSVNFNLFIHVTMCYFASCEVCNVLKLIYRYEF